MTERSEILQRAEEICQRAHVCRYCNGNGQVPLYLPLGFDTTTEWIECVQCKGTRQFPAPDVDALYSMLIELSGKCEQLEAQLRWCWDALEDIVSLCPDGPPPNGCSGETNDDFFFYGIEHGRWDAVEIAKDALERLTRLEGLNV